MALWLAEGGTAQVGSCRMLQRLAVEAPDALARCLPDVVPRVSECMVDAKDQVKVCICTHCATDNHNATAEHCALRFCVWEHHVVLSAATAVGSAAGCRL